MTKQERDAEAAFARKAFQQRASLNLEARKAIVASSKTRQVTLRLSDGLIGMAKHQAQAKGLPYQTYIKMLLHEALANVARSTR